MSESILEPSNEITDSQRIMLAGIVAADYAWHDNDAIPDDELPEHEVVLPNGERHSVVDRSAMVERTLTTQGFSVSEAHFYMGVSHQRRIRGKDEPANS